MIGPFEGDYRWLSNFSSHGVMFDGKYYRTVEHAFQGAKTLDPLMRETIRRASSPGKAKRFGHKAVLRPDWERVKVSVMLSLLKEKFGRDSNLKRKLIDTGDEDIVEKNHWGDVFWGVCEGKGENMLGKLLMIIRGELAAKHEAAMKKGALIAALLAPMLVEIK